MFHNNTRYRCFFSSLDSRELTYVNFSVRSELLSPRDPQLMDPSLPPCLGQRIVVAMRDCDLRGEDYLSYFPLTAPI